MARKCCCNNNPSCAQCDEGTTTTQYQLTVPSDLFTDSGCTGGCSSVFTGTWLLDYDEAATPYSGGTNICVYVSEVFDGCYSSTNTHDFQWRVEMVDFGDGPGIMGFIAYLRNITFGQEYIFNEMIFDGDCSQTLTNLNYNVSGSSEASLVCIVDETKKLSLEPA